MLVRDDWYDRTNRASRTLTHALNGYTKNEKAPRPGFEPGSKAPEASRMSTTLPRLLGNNVFSAYFCQVPDY